MTGRRIIPRDEWGARYGRGKDASSFIPYRLVVPHTEAGAMRPKDWRDLAGLEAELAAWRAAAGEIAKVRAVERFHAETRGWDGIGYSFFITFDGSIFEGRGWGRSGAHTEGHNFDAVAFCWEGHGDLESPTPAQWKSAEWLIAEGIRLGKIAPGYRLDGHRAFSLKGKTCPGTKVTERDLDRLRGLTATPPEEDLTMNEETARQIREIVREEVRAETGPIRGFIAALLEAAQEADAVFFGTGARRLRDRAGHLNPWRRK